MPALRYLACNLVSAAIWSAVVSLAGFTAGRVVMRLFEDLQRYEMGIVAAILAMGAVAVIVRSFIKTKT